MSTNASRHKLVILFSLSILFLGVGYAVDQAAGEKSIITQSDNPYTINIALVNLSAEDNDEYVVLYNKGNITANLLDWMVIIDNSKAFILPGYQITPLESIKIHFGKGLADSKDIYLNYSSNILDDQRGNIKIRQISGELIAEAKYHS